MNTDLATAAVALLIETGLAGCAAILLVLTLRRPVRSTFGADLGYALWLLVPLALLAVLVPAGTRPDAMQAVTVTVRALPEAIARPADTPALASPAGIILVVWLIGASAMAARLIQQQRRFLAGLGPIHTDAPGLLRAGSSAGLPAVIGIVRQHIVLPHDFETRFDAEQRALVLHHERIHIARHDTRINALVAVLRCLHWFNPLLHGAVARFRHDQELSCDAQVIACRPSARRRYGEAMLQTQLSDAALPLGCHWSGFERTPLFPLKERIAMLKSPVPSIARRRTGTTLVAALASLIAVSAAAVDVGNTTPHASEDVSYRRMAPPEYPSDALARREHGQVVLKVLVATDGSASQIELESSSGSESIDTAAITAVKTWQFNPGSHNGSPVTGWVLVPINFELNAPNGQESPATPEEADHDAGTATDHAATRNAPDSADTNSETTALDSIYIRPAGD